jgi:hypothetical protein
MDCQTDSLNNDQRIAGFCGDEEVDNLFLLWIFGG